jgi:hypothetical protein
MAGVAALLDQKLGSARGNLNPQLYPLAASVPAAFHDATVSSSGVSGCSVNTASMCNNSIPNASGSGVQAGFLLNTGYDEATGLGSLDVQVFLNNLSATKITPTVTVTPASSSITTVQPLSVTVVVNGGSGNPTPTGSVTLTGGGFASAPATLSGGSATINIPAGSLAPGSDTLTASYTPDSSSSSTYNSASGSAPVTVSMAAVAIISPVPGSTLTSASTTFTWNAGPAGTTYYLWIGTSSGALNLVNIGPLSGTSTTVNLPTNGSTIYVRLWTVFNGSTYLYNDYTYTEASVTAAAAITSPVPGTTLTAASTTFTWSAGPSGTTGYYLWIGTSPGALNLVNIGPLSGTSATVNLPTNGSTIYVRLWTVINGTTYLYNDYTYTAAASAVAAAIVSPAPGSTLTSASTTFTWNAGPSGTTGYYLWIGTSPGALNLVNIGPLSGTSATVNLPTNGSTIYVRLWTVINGTTFVYNDYTYTEFP